jgi:phenylpropionate dioxygenase-like ring-hydroxylating dioxygenase large terminal subunit
MLQLSDVGYSGSEAAVFRGLHSAHYTDPALFDVEKKRIFYREWICVGHVSMLPECGSYLTHQIIDQEVLVVRGASGEVRAFHNACRHRGHALSTGSGTCKHFVCPYHAWTYDLDGRLVNAPHSAGIAGFDKSAIRLSPVRLEIFCGMIFINLDSSARSFQEEFGFIEAELRKFAPEVENYQHVYDLEKIHRCNWKASVENYSECYHCAPVHHFLVANVIDPSTYELTVRGRTQRHFIRTRDRRQEQNLWWVYPNTGFGFYPVPNFGEVFCIRHMYPIDVETTDYHYRWFIPPNRDPAVVIDYAKHHAATTGDEDAAVAGGVQRGMRSIGFDQAILLANPKYGATSEHAIVQFQDWVRQSLERT